MFRSESLFQLTRLQTGYLTGSRPWLQTGLCMASGCRLPDDIYEEAVCNMLLYALIECESAVGGKLRGPDNLFENITKSTLITIDNAFPASKGNLQASDSKLEAELEVYKNETTMVINALVGEVNALTPVGSSLALVSR